MIPTEVGTFLLKVSTVDNRKVTPEAIDSWADILDERITLADAWQAARDHFAERAGDYLMPGHVNDRVRIMRRARLDAMRTPEPPDTLDPDDVRAHLTWQRAYRAAIGDGHDEQRADEIACATLGVTRPPALTAVRPVVALVQQTADALPRIPRGDAS
ncbi:hypothetical protein [Cellulomonas composti]|uniref:Uncharacterized protein n=1 Tax=Cellulomonas composti TaxID=266130 RepID=A0A511JBL1_9CELL|nr:hypothetical protein [Cellulomonas composti]GEL95381.1 hypothetical protein CCO02nite_20390 [Cellulomonas composti]